MGVGGRLLVVMGSTSQGWAHGARRVVFAIVMAGGAVLVVVPGAALAATVSVWHMDELSGTTMIDSAGTNNGTIKNVGLGLPGWSGSAYRFNGQSSIVTVPSSGSLNPGAANFTFTAKISYTATPPNSSTTDYDVLRKGTASDSAQFYKLEIRPDNRAVCRFVGSKTSSSGLSIHTGPTLNDGRWHSVICTKTATTIQLTIDAKTYTKSGTVGSITNTGSLSLGAKPGKTVTDHYNGSLDEVSISIG